MLADLSSGRDLIAARHQLIENLRYLAEHASFAAAVKHYTVVVLTHPQHDPAFQLMVAQAFEEFVHEDADIAQNWTETDFDGTDLP